MTRRARLVQVLLVMVVLMVAVFGHVAPVNAVTPYPLPGSKVWAVSEQFSSNDGYAYGVGVDASGLYAVGADNNTVGTKWEWRVEKRSLTSGALVWGVSEDISNGDDVARAVAVDGTGIYVAGWDYKPSTYEWRVEKRSLATGVILWAVSEHISTSSDSASGVAVDASGVYVSGYDHNGPGATPEWRVEKRSLTTGALIWAQSEYINCVEGSGGYANGVGVDASGVYVAGTDYCLTGYNEWRVEKRSLTTGAVIWAVSEQISSTHDYAYNVAIDASGVYVVGYDHNGAGSTAEWRVEKRSLTSGALIWGVSEHISSDDDHSESIAVDGSGVYVVGRDYSPGNYEWRVEKRSLTTGAILWAQSEDISSATDLAFGVAVDASGVYVVGYDKSPGPGHCEWRVERRSKPQGDLVSATGMGMVTFTVNNGSFLGLTGKAASGVSPLAPAGLTFPYGLFNFTVGNLTVGASVNVTATLPAPLPNGPLLMYWTFHNGVWRQLPASHFMVAANRTLFMLNLTDGVASDDQDETANRVIVDLGGVAYAYNVTLVPGWNLISLPVVPVDPTATNMLRSLVSSGKLVSVWGYTGTPRTWKYYLPGKASTLTTLNDGYGYWVYMRSADTLYVNGTVIPPASAPPAYALLVGWDLVGFKSQPNATAPKTVGQFLLSINGTYDSANVWIYDNSNGVWIDAIQSTTLHPGDAMWIYVTSTSGTTLRP